MGAAKPEGEGMELHCSPDSITSAQDLPPGPSKIKFQDIKISCLYLGYLVFGKSHESDLPRRADLLLTALNPTNQPLVPISQPSRLFC